MIEKEFYFEKPYKLYLCNVMNNKKKGEFNIFKKDPFGDLKTAVFFN